MDAAESPSQPRPTRPSLTATRHTGGESHAKHGDQLQFCRRVFPARLRAAAPRHGRLLADQEATYWRGP
eukprot:4139454-Prymnesium_polylepis.1